MPNEVETHLITRHRVPPTQLAQQREHCKAQGIDYEEFLETNHAFIHHMSECNHEVDEK